MNSLSNPSVPSAALWSAAVAGLLGATVVACDTGDDHDHEHTDEATDTDDGAGDDTDGGDTDVTGPVITSTTSREDLTFAVFSEECEAAGGVVQVHATCAGNNACRGMSFNKWSKDYTEHTCKAMNSCGGASCVLTPEDQGRDAAELYEESCGSMCHGAGFTVYVAPGEDEATELANFAASTTAARLTRIAFGGQHLTADGTYLANMPGFHDKISRAEMIAIAEHLSTLEATATTYGVPGENEDFTDH